MRRLLLLFLLLSTTAFAQTFTNPLLPSGAGLLSASINADLMNLKSWKTHFRSLFGKSVENGVYALGHNSFFKSPDGKGDRILYHANDKPGQGCGGFRSPRAQKFILNADGKPHFGTPVKPGVALNDPAN